MPLSRHNHFVPQWYQKGFLPAGQSFLHYLNLQPDTLKLPNGQVKTLPACNFWPPSRCFKQQDLYTTVVLGTLNDEIERLLFGSIDTTGSEAVRAFIGGNFPEVHASFEKFFEYLDAQKLRTPKGLNWISTCYPQLNQMELMLEMQKIRRLHCTMWVEAVREIVSAKSSEVKFIITDHPVTIYNRAAPPTSPLCRYPMDPAIASRGSQTIFPLDSEHCLILTNLEYARDPINCDPLADRTHARNFAPTVSRTDTMIRSRALTIEQVTSINFILKARANRYIAAAKEAWLYPERTITTSWKDVGDVLIPPHDELWHFGGEIFIGKEDGSVHYQDEFGRTSDHKHLKRPQRKGKQQPNDRCKCGSGKKYKKCCRDRTPENFSVSDEYSIRERNLMFYRGINEILGLSKGKDWESVRRDISEANVKEIHELYGALWPIDTDITALLPKPDPRILRGLYTGFVDPRTIPRSAGCLAPYFDELIVLNPFMNPAIVASKFSPVLNPGQHKQQTIKNVALLATLIPFIEMGLVNLIPDPCNFHPLLLNEVLTMTKERFKDQPAMKQEAPIFERLLKEDVERMMLNLPREILKQQFQEKFPEKSEQDIDAILDYIERARIADPFSLLQPQIPTEGQGQLLVAHITPNHELSLFLAQITGSILLTDSAVRWSEIKDSAVTPETSWTSIAECLSEFNLPAEINSIANVHLWRLPKVAAFRASMKRALSAVREDQPSSRMANALSDDLRISGKAAILEFKDLQENLRQTLEIGPMAQLHAKLECLIPAEGFGRNTVQRLLIAFGSGVRSPLVPMALSFRVNTDTVDL
jgi:hypothetical protein